MLLKYINVSIWFGINSAQQLRWLSDVINHCCALTTLVIDSDSIVDLDFCIDDELAKHTQIMKLPNTQTITPNTLANRRLFTSKSFVLVILQFSNLRHLEISGTPKVNLRQHFWHLEKHASANCYQCQRYMLHASAACYINYGDLM